MPFSATTGEGREKRENFEKGYFKVEGSFNRGRFTEALQGVKDLEKAKEAAMEILKKQKAAALKTYGDIPTIRNADLWCNIIFVGVEEDGPSEDGLRSGGPIEKSRIVGRCRL